MEIEGEGILMSKVDNRDFIVLSLSVEEKKELCRRTLHVRNLDDTVTAQELEQLFSNRRKINRVTVFKKPDEQCFAYIEYEHEAIAILACQMFYKMEYRGRELDTMIKEYRPKTRPSFSLCELCHDLYNYFKF